MKKNWISRFKWKNITIFISILVFIFFVFYLGYNIWANWVESPSEPLKLSFTVTPVGGGLGDKLTEDTIIPPIGLKRIGKNQVDSGFMFGPFEKFIYIEKIKVHPMVYVADNTTIEVTIKVKDLVKPIGSFLANGGSDLPDYSSADLNESVNMFLDSGETGTINIIAKDTEIIIISTDTYIWLEGLQSKSAPVDSWWGFLLSNTLFASLFITLFTFIVREELFETEEQMQRKQQLKSLVAIEKQLKSVKRLLKQIKDDRK